MAEVNQQTVSTDQYAVTSNKYLEDIETWRESDLPYYKKKVRDRIFSSYTSIIGGLAVAYLFYGVFISIAMTITNSFYDLLLNYPIAQWGCIALTAIIVLFVIKWFGKRSIVKFVDACHGEIGHAGYPFIKKLKANLIISIILAVAITAGLIFLLNPNKPSNSNLLILETFIFLPALIAPFGHLWGTLSGLSELPICPVCGRYNTIYKVKLGSDFGTRKDGHHQEYAYETERVGTKTTTTYYSDGTSKSNSEGIYSSVRYIEEYDDFSSLAKYAYFCNECSYAEESLEEKKWKTLESKYRG